MSENGQWHGGKGSKYRPVDTKKYAENWEKIFRKKEKEPHDIEELSEEDLLPTDGC